MKIKFLALLLLGCTFQVANSFAATAPGDGGVSLGATRLIYPSDKSQITVKIYNTNQTGNFLVQSWVSDENGKKVNDFVVTPPLFVLKANTDNVLRLVYTGDMNALPKDKEKIFFFNSKVIPSLTEEQKQAHNALLIATTTKIKIFMRPSTLAQGSLEAYKKIQCSYSNNKIKVTNPTPYYMNLVSLQVNGKDVTKSATIAPNADVYIDTTAKGSKLTFEAINDYGALANSSCNLSN